MSTWSLTYRQSVFKRRQSSLTNISKSFTYRMAAKLRHCHPMYILRLTSRKLMVTFAAWADQTKVADRNKLSLLWSPTCSGNSYSLAQHFNFGLCAPPLPSRQKYIRGRCGRTFFLAADTNKPSYATAVVPMAYSIRSNKTHLAYLPRIADLWWVAEHVI